MSDPPSQRATFAAAVVPGLLFLAALALMIPRLAYGPGYVFDEIYHAFTAGEYVAGNPDAFVPFSPAPREGVAYMWNHPPAGVLLIAAGILVWGDQPLGWRIPGVVFGAAGVVLAYALAWRVTRDRLAATLTSGLLLLDGLYFVQSRIALLDIFVVVFCLGALLAFHAYWTAPPPRIGAALTGVAALFGLAVATKWNAAFPAIAAGVAILGRTAAAWRGRANRGRWPQAPANLRAHAIWIPVSLLLALTVYLLTYVPFFLVGHDVGEWIELHDQTLRYHLGLEETHPYQSSWWQWPLALRPVWYHVAEVGERVANIYAQGNPAIYWALVPAVLWVGWRWIRERNTGGVLLLAIGFFGQWLPWVLVPRSAFLYHFLPAVPFGVLALGVAVSRLVRRGGLGRWCALAYLTAVVAAFAFFYPIYAGIPLTPEAFERRLWLPSWR